MSTAKVMESYKVEPKNQLTNPKEAIRNILLKLGVNKKILENKSVMEIIYEKFINMDLLPKDISEKVKNNEGVPQTKINEIQQAIETERKRTIGISHGRLILVEYNESGEKNFSSTFFEEDNNIKIINNEYGKNNNREVQTIDVYNVKGVKTQSRTEKTNSQLRQVQTITRDPEHLGIATVKKSCITDDGKEVIESESYVALIGVAIFVGLNGAESITEKYNQRHEPICEEYKKIRDTLRMLSDDLDKHGNNARKQAVYEAARDSSFLSGEIADIQKGKSELKTDR